MSEHACVGSWILLAARGLCLMSEMSFLLLIFSIGAALMPSKDLSPSYAQRSSCHTSSGVATQPSQVFSIFSVSGELRMANQPANTLFLQS